MLGTAMPVVGLKWLCHPADTFLPSFCLASVKPVVPELDASWGRERAEGGGRGR